ncbi:hypothetical protein CFP56_034184 [Quercus suber]|uniref:DC1 domain-containing protein n=1 Tax=Quercus suber TaxID=58331 RepID=A0AAW0LQZ5_QUESU
MEAEFHDHPLIPIWKSFTFTCDICGKEGKGTPYMCQLCSFWVHGRCAYQFPRIVKVVRHKHLLQLTHSSLEFHQSDSRFCQICVQKVDTHYGLYYCSRCDFATHLDCAMQNKENINLQEFKDEDEVSELNESVDSTTYKVKFNMREDGTKIATEIKHFSHEHDLKLIDEVLNNQKCDGCVRAIFPPFYSCVKCSFFLHESCANLPNKKRHPLHQRPLTLLPMKPNVLQCRILQDTNNMNIPSLSVIELKMTLVNIIAISVNKNDETQSIGFTTVRIAVILLIQIVSIY